MSNGVPQTRSDHLLVWGLLYAGKGKEVWTLQPSREVWTLPPDAILWRLLRGKLIHAALAALQVALLSKFHEAVCEFLPRDRSSMLGRGFGIQSV